MVTLVGALAGIRIAGIAGLVFGPVALDLFLTLVGVYRREYSGNANDMTPVPHMAQQNAVNSLPSTLNE